MEQLMTPTTKKIEVVIKHMADCLIDIWPDEIQDEINMIKDSLHYLGSEPREILFLQTELNLRYRILADIGNTYTEEPDCLSEQLQGWICNYQLYLQQGHKYDYSIANEDYTQYKARRLSIGDRYKLNFDWSQETLQNHLDTALSNATEFTYRYMLTALENAIIKMYANKTYIELKEQYNIQLLHLMIEQFGNTRLYFFDTLSFAEDKYQSIDIVRLVAVDIDAATETLKSLRKNLSAGTYGNIKKELSEIHIPTTIAELTDYAYNGGIDISPETQGKIDTIEDGDCHSMVIYQIISELCTANI